MRTDLVEAPLVGEDGDVSVVACTSYMPMRGAAVSMRNGQTRSPRLRGASNTPDMMAAGF